MNETRNTDEERFWEHVLHLQNQIRSELDKWDKPELRMASKDRMDLTSLYLDRGTRSYLREVLKVQGGSFGIAHRSSNQFKLVQAAFKGLPDELPQLRLPYGEDEIGVAFVDLAFTSLRDTQPLQNPVEVQESSERGKRKYSVLPEFYFQLPPLGDKHPCVSDEEEERRSRGVDLLLCPTAEVSFFIWAWLWIRRLTSRGSKTPLDVNDEGSAPRTLESTFWNQEKDHDLSNPPADVMFAEFIDDLRKAKESPETVKVLPNYLDAAWSQWERIEEIDSRGEEDLLLACGVPSGGKFNESISGLIGFALQLGREQERHIKDAAALNWMIEVRDALSDLEDALSNFERSSFSLYEDDSLLMKLKKNLRRITIFALLGGEKDSEYLDVSRIYNCRSLKDVADNLRLDAYEALKRIHKLARFPIIQYYCLQLVLGKPLEHLVFPVWKSFKYKETMKQENGTRLDTPDVVLALLSITAPESREEVDSDPIQGPVAPSRSENPERKCHFSSESRQRVLQLSRIQCIMKVMAGPLIDYGFYGSLVGMEQDAEGVRNAYHSIPGAFASTIDKLVAYAAKHDDFTVPAGLYLAAFQAMMSQGRTPIEIKKMMIRLPKATEILHTHGISGPLFDYLLDPDGVVLTVSRDRIMREQLRFRKPSFHYTIPAAIPVEPEEDGTDEYIIPVLILLLKEACEHSIRVKQDVDTEPSVSVEILPDEGKIRIINDCSPNADLVESETGAQAHYLKKFMKWLEPSGWTLDKLKFESKDRAVREIRKGGVTRHE